MAFLVVVMGCAAGTSSFDAKAYPENWVAIDRMLVIANLEAAPPVDKLHRGLEEGLTSGLIACGVEPKIVHPGPLDADKDVNAAANVFGATATMVIVARGTEISRGRALSYAEKHHFDLAIFDVDSGHVVWRASSVLDLGTPGALDDDTRSGRRFAASIIARLQADVVLRSCRLPGS